ncbi:hypothetical protein POTOM_059276 [Populus tomentosa]|uniref:Uncharacterized protein n=1 Tax=Populus tomentosa TaxID=118781 RepID=A0A8X7XSP4_POPTO|nr:hypothetical protein POTOM_059276 [Populus tomentosa]
MAVPNNGTEQGHEEVMSKERNLNREGGYGSFGSMLDSLPTQRRGLAMSYDGKCKSFADLSEARTVKDLEKKEHPFNQRRALLKARKMCKRSKAQIASAEAVVPKLPHEIISSPYHAQIPTWRSRISNMRCPIRKGNKSSICRMSTGLKHFVSNIKRGNKNAMPPAGGACVQMSEKENQLDSYESSFPVPNPAILLPHTGNSKS